MWWVFLGILLVATPAWAGQSPVPGPRAARTPIGPVAMSPEERLARARQAYLNNDFLGAIDLARELVYPMITLRREEDVIGARRVLALAYLLIGDEGSSEREFSALLALAPDFALDPVLDPPQAITFLERLRARERQRIEEIERRRREEAEAAAREAEKARREEEARRIEEIRRSLKPLIIERHNRWLCLVPFGVGQFQNRQPGKGTAFLVSQIALGAASVGLWATLEYSYDAGRRKVPRSEEGTAIPMQYSTLVLGGLFWADVAWGVIDALVHFQPQVVVDDPGFQPKLRTSLVPFLPPGGGAGLSLQGAF